MGICSLLVPALLVLTPISERPQMNTVAYFDWKLQVTERVLDRSICEDIERTRSVDKEAYPRMTERQKEVAESKARNDKKRSRAAVATHCKNSLRVKAAKGVDQCDLEPR